MMKVVRGFIFALLFTCAVPSDVLEDCSCSFFIQKDNNKEELFKLASMRLNECSLYRSECESHCKEQFNEFIKNEATEDQSLYDLACKKYQYDIQDAEYKKKAIEIIHDVSLSPTKILETAGPIQKKIGTITVGGVFTWLWLPMGFSDPSREKIMLLWRFILYQKEIVHVHEGFSVL